MYNTRGQQYRALSTTSNFGQLLEETAAQFIPCGPYCILVVPMFHYDVDKNKIEAGTYVVVTILTEESDTVVLTPKFMKEASKFESTVRAILATAPSNMFLGDWGRSKDTAHELSSGIYAVEQYFTEDDLYPVCDEIIEQLLKAEFPNADGGLLDVSKDKTRGVLFTKPDAQLAISSQSTALFNFLMIDDTGFHKEDTDICFCSFDYSTGFVLATGPYAGDLLAFGDDLIPSKYESASKERSSVFGFAGPENNALYAVRFSDIGPLNQVTQRRACNKLLEVSKLLVDNLQYLFRHRRYPR